MDSRLVPGSAPEVRRIRRATMTTDSPVGSPGDLVFNGIDAVSGQYLVPPMSSREVAEIAGGLGADDAHLRELKWWHQRAIEASFGPKEGVDPLKLEAAGWGARSSMPHSP